MKTNRKQAAFFVAFVFLFIALVLTRINRSGSANFGWVQLNQGMSNEDEQHIYVAQSILSDNLSLQQRQRYSMLWEAKLKPDELMFNGGFEFFSQGWVVQGENNMLPQITNEEAFSGYNSLRITFPDEDINFYQTFQEVEVAPDACYLLRARLKTENMIDGVALEIWDAERGYQYWYGGQTSAVSGTVDWEPVVLEFCTESDIFRIQVRLRRYGGKGQSVSGTAWFDDIHLKLLKP